MARVGRTIHHANGDTTVLAPPAVHAIGVPRLGVEGLEPGVGAAGVFDPPTPLEIIQAQAAKIRELLDQREQDLVAMKTIGGQAIVMTRLLFDLQGRDPENGFVDIPRAYVDDCAGMKIDVTASDDRRSVRVQLRPRASASIVSGEGTR